MGRPRELFTLYLVKGRKRDFWYFRTYDEYGRRTCGKSTGKEVKSEAYRHCMNLYEQGVLLGGADPKLRDWAEARHWWEWGECEYISGKLARSSPDKPAITRRHAHLSGLMMENHVLPHLGDMKLSTITPRIIEKWMFTLLETRASKTVNNVSTVLRTMLTEAYRLEMIPRNPYDKVRPLTSSSEVRGVMTMNEAKAVLDNPELWSNPVYYAANLLAAVTGMRQGEVLALRRDHLYPDHIYVEFSWDRKFGLGPPKTKEVRHVPIPVQVYDVLVALDSYPYVLSMSGGEYPATGSHVTDALYAVLKQIGVDRKDRNISFHSWRHFANTYLRAAGVPDSQVQHVTGHRTLKMTDHYTHFGVEHFEGAIAAQTKLLALPESH